MKIIELLITSLSASHILFHTSQIKLKWVLLCIFNLTTQGKLKAKRLQQLMSSFKSSDLGPYGGGSYSAPNGKTVKLQQVPLTGLKDGLNEERVVIGKVVCSFATDEPIPL